MIFSGRRENIIALTLTRRKLGVSIMAKLRSLRQSRDSFLNRSELKQAFSIDHGALMFKKLIQLIESQTQSVYRYRFKT